MLDQGCKMLKYWSCSLLPSSACKKARALCVVSPPFAFVPLGLNCYQRSLPSVRDFIVSAFVHLCPSDRRRRTIPAVPSLEFTWKQRRRHIRSHQHDHAATSSTCVDTVLVNIVPSHVHCSPSQEEKFWIMGDDNRLGGSKNQCNWV